MLDDIDIDRDGHPPTSEENPPESRFTRPVDVFPVHFAGAHIDDGDGSDGTHTLMRCLL